MIDVAYIEELKALDKKEAKQKLYDYAQEFNVQLKKTRSFENMVADFKEELAKLANEPMPVQNEGLTITDLIQAADEVQDKTVFKGEAKEEAVLLIDSVETPELKAYELVNDMNTDTETVHAPEADVKVSLEVAQDDVIKAVEPKVEETIVEVEKPKPAAPGGLPRNFSPTIVLLGKAPGYYTLPWWIYQWIEANPDWTDKIKSFPHPSAHNTLYSLLYYIQRDGSVTIRETRNSSFVVLS